MSTQTFRRAGTTFVAFLLVLLVAVPAVHADTKMLMKSHTDAFQVMGQSQPAEDNDVTLWIGEGRAVRDDGDTRLIFRGDQKKVYVVDLGAKEYSVLDLPIDILKMVPEEQRAQMEPMLKAMEMTAEVVRTDRTDTVGDWAARLYEVTLSNSMGMKIESKVWASEEVGVDQNSFRELSMILAAMQPGGAAVRDELMKIEGVPVLMESEIQAMGGSTKSSETLLSAEEATAPAGIYEVPAGYELREFNPMGR